MKLGRRLLRAWTASSPPLTVAPPAATPITQLPYPNPADVVVGTTIEHNRDAWIRAQLGTIPKGARLLDAGAGEQPFRALAKELGLQYVAQDLAQYDGHGDGTALQTGNWDYRGLDLVCDITTIPEPSASFDAILCTSVFEHIPDPVSALREFSRLLKKGGRLVLCAPTLCAVHFAPFIFYSGFSKYFYQKYLTAAGFKICSQEFNGSLFEHMATLIRQLPAHTARYADVTPTREEEHAIATMLRLLQRAEDGDNGSNEFCAADLMIVAERI
jgi:ubiquinone/menaquinone biosynthesis C-methylase UbiE